ncbi:HigA family addiction module antitoxin [Brevundimonas sp. NPDC055814]
MPDHDFSTFAAPLAHPGEHLREDYLPEGGLSPTNLANALDIDEHTADQILACKHPITPALATGLTELFDTSPEFWLNLQAAHDASSQALEDNSAVSLSQANDQ